MGKTKESSSAVGTSAAGGKKGTATARVTDGGWRRSETRESDLRKLRERGLIPQDTTAVKLPGNEVIPRPPSGYRVMFLAFVMRGFLFQSTTSSVDCSFSMASSFIIFHPILFFTLLVSSLSASAGSALSRTLASSGNFIP